MSENNDYIQLPPLKKDTPSDVVIRTVPIIQFLILQCLNIIWTCVLSRTIKKNKKKSLLKRIFLWAVGIIVVLTMAFET